MYIIIGMGKLPERVGRKAVSLRVIYDCLVAYFKEELAMKRFLALLLATAILFAQTVVLAEEKGSGGRFITQGDYMYYVPDGAKGLDRNIPKGSVGFFLELSGLQLDAGGNLCDKARGLFTDIVALSELKDTTLNWKYRVDVGNGVTEDDVLNMVKVAPDDDSAFANTRKQLMDKGYIISDKGDVIPWANLNSNHYRIDWFVFKHANDGWHIDGRIVDLKSNDIVDVVVPDNPKDIPPEAYEEEEKAPTDESIHLGGATYAYIFGYEPVISYGKDENGNPTHSAQVFMGMDDYVTVEQVSSMLMRLLDQENYTNGHSYAVTPSIEPYRNDWYARGLAYQCEVGGLPSEGNIPLGNVSRAMVANLVSHALKLNLTSETPFSDIAGNKYEEDIEKVYAYGYMVGLDDDHFAPDKIMTRAEFCKLFNNIIGRDKMGLTALDASGNPYEITPADYSIVDMSPNHWAYSTCLKATSAYDDNGYVSPEKRQENIRNKLDDYNSQLLY